MSGPSRLASGGLIDRSKPLQFSFAGRRYQGFAGDTLASALLANGVRVVGRSFKYHRPRGIMALGAQDASALVNVTYGAAQLANLRPSEVELADGLIAEPVHAWPWLSLDLGAVSGLFSRFIGAGFYYKTFMSPHWYVYEWAIRRAAGLGGLSPAADTPPAAHRYHHCDVLVIGGGPSGLSAARDAARGGKSVLLAEQELELGGQSLARGSGAERADCDELRRTIEMRTGMTALGIYDHRSVMLIERRADGETLWLVRAHETILATGALELPLVFPGNDRPGVMLASAAAICTQRFGVRLGTRVVLITNNDKAYETALNIDGLCAVLDLRGPVSATAQPIRERGIQVTSGVEVLGTTGWNGVRSVRFRTGGSVRELGCDAIAMSGGFAPNLNLYSQAGGALRFDDRARAFTADGEVRGFRVVGRAAGGALVPTPALQLPTHDRRHAFVDFQNDVTVADIEIAAQEKFTSVEHLKRYTTLGMASDQGKSSNVNGIAVLSALTGKPPRSIGTTRFRPPYVPVSVGTLAGQRRGALYKPERRTALYGWHAAHRAGFEEFGDWMRPVFYPRAGETRETAMAREALAVRQAAGLFDNSPLGKIEVIGPDAARFLDFIYATRISTLKPGHLRYGIMLNEHGVVMDDGVVARLSEDRFWLSTTSGGAGRVAQWLEEWLQCEFRSYRVIVAPVTSQWSVPTLTGPGARAIIASLPGTIDFSREAFPHMQWRDGEIAGAPVRVLRASFTGEISYEIYTRHAHGVSLWERFSALGAVPVGLDAWLGLRTEKGYLHLGSDTDGTTLPGDVGFAHVLKRHDDFAGKRSLLRPAPQRGERLQLVGLEPVRAGQMLDVGTHLTAPGHPSIGYVTSSFMSPILQRCVAMGMVKDGERRMGEVIDLARGLGQVRVVPRAAYDPEGVLLHG